VYDHFRKVKRTPVHSDVKEFEEKLEGEHHTDSQLEKEQEIRTLERAMGKLSDENRELLILCRFQELKYNEIASLLNVSVRTVEVRIGKALHLLRYYLNEYFPVVLMILIFEIIF
jgi:RNA polymerase sigma-70 factor (ECF subfamily)